LRREDEQLDRILARGYLGGPRYDEIWARVSKRTVAPRSAQRWRRFSPALAWAATLGGVLLFAGANVDFSKVRAKGTNTTESPMDAIEVGCSEKGDRVCETGSTLMITVNAAVVSGFVGAYAERIGAPLQDRIWYFPTSEGQMPEVVPGQSTVVLPKGIRIGEEHEPGRYRVTVWIASRLIDRSEVDSLSSGVVRTRSTFDLEIVRD
jgi:hypothetical protein